MATPDTDNTKQVPLSELGGTGLRNTHGNIDEEVIRDLQFPQCINTYKQMETDALISGALFAVKQFIKGADWKVEEYTGVDKPADAAEQKRFLEQCMDDMEKSFDESRKQRMQDEWHAMLHFVECYFPHGFKKSNSRNTTPRVRFEAISVGVTLALRQKPDLEPSPKEIDEWVNGWKFNELVTSDAANSRTKVMNRIKFVRDKLLGEL